MEESIADRIDHTILRADAREEDVRRCCREARDFHFHSVCVNSCHALLVSEELKGSGVLCCCVVGFPLGAALSEAKALEAKRAVEAGAAEIDMVLNVGALKDGRDDYVREDIRGVVEAARPGIVKVILETCLLSEEEKRRACRLSEEAGAAFVKTSTGFSGGGATIEDVKLMKAAVGGRLKVKASGGIRDPRFARELIDAGADRLGASDGRKLL